MAKPVSLIEYLSSLRGRSSQSEMVAETILQIADAALNLSAIIALGSLDENLAAEGKDNFQGEVQKRLDVIANDAFIQAVRRAPVATLLSEELRDPLILDEKKSIAVALDPVDGSSNIGINGMIGTIFSILPAKSKNLPASFLQPGHNQIAAGHIVYGAQTQLALTLGNGTVMFTLDRRKGEFFLTGKTSIAPRAAEFSINVANYRHWPDGIRNYVNDCLAGADGPLERNYNMRWLGAVVGEVHRILQQGGIYLYPSDRRPGYHEGRLRLVYEGNPVAFLIEQAGGSATDGQNRILDLEPMSHHQRTALCFGAIEDVMKVKHYLTTPDEEPAPLFGHRGLFRVKD